jgi:hypothetical protein
VLSIDENVQNGTLERPTPDTLAQLEELVKTVSAAGRLIFNLPEDVNASFMVIENV